MNSRRNRISGQFSPKLVEMLESPAHRVLSLSGRRVLDRIEIEHAHHGGKENGNLPVTFEHFCEYGMHRHSVEPGMREAVALGFLVITKKGQGGNAEFRSPNKFRLTYRDAPGIPGDGSHEWRRISSMDEAQAIADAARKAKAPKRTKSQCRKVPSFGDKNRHRNIKIPVTKTGTRSVAKTGTTSISRDIPPEQSAREARPSGSAVASGPTPTSAPASLASPPLALGERADIVLSRVAGRLGTGEAGWLIVQEASEPDLENLLALEARGELNAATLAATRLKYRRGAA